VAAEIRDALGIEVELIDGGGGIFDVCVDGKLVFSKANVGRFPEDGEGVECVRAVSG